MQLAKEIETMIADDLDRGRQLLALLKQENTAVKQRSFDLIQQLLDEKTPLMEQLKSNGQKRNNWLSSVKKSHPNADWPFILKQLSLEHLSETWAEAKKIMEECQTINIMNGQLLHRGIKCNERLLGILQGNHQNDTLYNAKGMQRSGNKMLSAYACA